MQSVRRCSVRTANLRGIESLPVVVEVSTSGGIPGLTIVGMPDAAVLEARSRIRCAIKSMGFEIPRLHITVNLAPSDMRKVGTGFDLPIAAAVLCATGQLDPTRLSETMLVGELALDGRVRPVRGMIAHAIHARGEGLRLCCSAAEPLSEVFDPWYVESLADLRLPRGDRALPPLELPGFSCCGPEPDFADVIDQEVAKRVMVVSATGNHGLLMVGAPGTGKTMLARRLPGILPPLSSDELIEPLLVHSVCGLPTAEISVGRRPFRSPHHSVSTAGLVGGGRPVLPGEISLAHKGVLFLDELPEFARNALQALRQPLEEGEVRLVRVDGVYTFPSDFLLVGAANPCPCGHLGDPRHACRCRPSDVERYAGRIGGPLRDRIDLQVDVTAPDSAMVVSGEIGKSTTDMRSEVRTGRSFALWRESHPVGDQTVFSTFDDRARRLLESYATSLGFGGRGIVRCARVARTIADLAERERVNADDVAEAAIYRARGLVEG